MGIEDQNNNNKENKPESELTREQVYNEYKDKSPEELSDLFSKINRKMVIAGPAERERDLRKSVLLELINEFTFRPNDSF
jgi:hypothetical protein